jgi:hypothetical protein
MSIIGTRHSLSLFTAGESKPASGQRLAKIGYKQTAAMTKAGETAPPSVCASVPQVDPAQITANIDRLLPYIGTMIEAAQDGIIRSLYESAGHTLISVDDADISVSACISYLAAEAAGDRLKKDVIEQWFDSEVSENLTVFLAEKLGFTELTADNMKVIDRHVGIYRSLIGSLAGGKTILETKQINGCKKAISLSATADRIAQRLTDRLIAMEAPKKKIEEFLDIGAD